MMTVKQVSSLTGVSVRTLQFYDEIGLLKPTKITDAGYRLYDDFALEVLQQILFFKELDFTLKEIKTIMEDPQFDKTAAYKKQQELIQIKRDRLDGLLGLLDKLIKGEKCMEFKDFDMSGYFHILNEFKETHTDKIIKQLGGIDQFDKMITDMQTHEREIADMAIKQYGSIENYTNAMKKNFADYLDKGPKIVQEEANSLVEKTETITKHLTEDLTKDVASQEVQAVMEELISFINTCNNDLDMGENFWPTMAQSYLSNPTIIEITNRKYGEGASKFIGMALQVYLKKQRPDKK